MEITPNQQKTDNAQVSEEPVQNEPKKDKKKLLFSLAGVLIILLVATFLFFNHQSTTTTPATQTTQRKASVAANEYLLINVLNTGSGDSNQTNYRINLSNLKQDKLAGPADPSAIDNFLVSPDDKKIAKINSKTLSISDVSLNPSFSTIATLGTDFSGKTWDFTWIDDSSGLIVVTDAETYSGPKGTPSSIPTSHQTFYKLPLSTKKPVVILNHSEVYGAGFVLGTNVKDDQLHWSTAGEGGPREVLISSRLSDGSKINSLKADGISSFGGYLNGNYYFSDDHESDFSKVQLDRYSASTGKSEVLYTTAAAPAASKDDGNRTPGYSLFPGAIQGSDANKIIFSETGWSKGKSTTTVYELDLTSKKTSILYTLADQPSDVDITPLVWSHHGLIASTYCNLCGGAGAPGSTPGTLLLIANGQSKKIYESKDIQFSHPQLMTL
jgi:hypothetical protein